MKIVKQSVIIKGMRSCAPDTVLTKFTDEDGVTIYIETEVIKRIASLIEYEESRLNTPR